MAKRPRIELTEEPGNSYFVSDKTDIKFVPTGCTLLNCVLGGGYVLGRIVNIVGDKSTAKTALATEAMINFLRTYKNGVAAYRESEAAFDRNYAAAMGLPVDVVDFGDPKEPLLTVEDFYRDFDRFLNSQSSAKEPGIYVLDSLDALSDEAEMDTDIGKGTYGMAKAKQLSVMFRKITRKIERSQVLLLVISQVRDNIGVTHGDKQRRSGGKALDFYASQILWLAHVGILKKTINKVERPYGVTIRAKVKKNKVAFPFRECDFNFIFGFGIDDVRASVEWLQEVGRLKDVELSNNELKAYFKELDGYNQTDYQGEQQRTAGAVITAWHEIEKTFLPVRSKY